MNLSIQQQPSNNNNNEERLPPTQRLYVGKWTREEEEYVDGLIENFRAGNIPDIADGTTLRNWLAGKLCCRVKRISKRYENTGYNGRAQYKDKEARYSSEVYANMTKKLQDQKLAFLASREQVMQGLAYARGSRRNRVSRATTAAAAAEAAARRGGPAVGLGPQLLAPAPAVANVTTSGGVLPVLNLETALAASVRAASASLLPPSSLGGLTVGLVGGTQLTPLPPPPPPSSAAATAAPLLGLGAPAPAPAAAAATTASSLAVAQAAAQAIAAATGVSDPSVDLLLRAALIQKLSASSAATPAPVSVSSAPAPDAPGTAATSVATVSTGAVAPPAPAPVAASTQALIAVAAAQHQQLQPVESSAATASSLIEALKLRQQIQEHQDRAAVLGRALQEHLVAAALGNNNESVAER